MKSVWLADIQMLHPYFDIPVLPDTSSYSASPTATSKLFDEKREAKA